MTDYFSPDYPSARARFRAAVFDAGGHIESILLDARGPKVHDSSTDDLTIDIGWFGSPEPARVLIHSCGLHGVEGFAGSAIQLQWLAENPPKQLPADGAVVMVHALNPFGMAWLRRVNENNVDLNHNFRTADEEFQGAPPLYQSLNSFLNPAAPDFFLLRAVLALARYGPSAFRQALAAGQYEFPQGLSFGGKRREQSVRRFQLYIAGKLINAEHVIGIDVHTGVGCCGPSALEGLYRRMCPTAKIDFSLQQLNSCNSLSALRTLRDENRQHHSGVISSRTSSDLLRTFAPTGSRWRERALHQGSELIQQGMAHAFATTPPPVTDSRSD